MAPKAPKTKTRFKPVRWWEPIHTSGEAAITSDSQFLISCIDQSTIISDLNSGKKNWTIDGDSTSVTSICATNCCPTVQPTTFFLIAYRSLSIRIYSLETLNPSDSSIEVGLIRTTSHAHEAPISLSCSDPTGSLFATGDTAGVVRVWDARAGHCTHVFKGHGGIISALTFDIDLNENRARLAVGSGDCRIKLWDLTSKKLVGLFEGGHASIIRGLAITLDGQKMVSGSRDKVVIVWNLCNTNDSGKRILKTIPTFETIESIGLIYPSPNEDPEMPPPKKKSRKSISKSSHNDQNQNLDSPIIFTAGERGVVKLWNIDSGALIDSEENHSDFPDNDLVNVGISDTRLDRMSNTLLVNKIDQTFSLLKMPSLELVRQVIGSHDEIIDMSLLKSNQSSEESDHLALATNSPFIRILNLGEAENDCRMLAGHSDIVLCLAKPKNQNWFVSGSKDKTARVWKSVSKPDPNDSSRHKFSWRSIGICEGHVQSLGALSIAEFLDSNGKPITLLATASQDRTVKLWDLSEIVSNTTEDGKKQDQTSPAKPKSSLTMQIHDKDINSIDFSADCKLLGSGSQDKLGKLFSVEYSAKMGTSLHLVAILKGHNRGIWAIKFSQTDPFVITGSGDCTIKLWSTADQKVHESHPDADLDSRGGIGSCLKTFEGHSNSILRLDFTNFGQQIISTSSDCLIKIWDIKTQVCVTTLGDETEEDELEIRSSAKSMKQRSMIDGHEGKIWAIDVFDQAGSRIITGGADSRLICWKEVSTEMEERQIQSKQKEVELNQDLENFIRVKDYSSVIKLLIKLDKPVKLLKLFVDLEAADGLSSDHNDEFGELDRDASVTGSTHIDQILQNLNTTELMKFLNYITTWNSVSKTSGIAQKLLFLIFKSKLIQEILSDNNNQDNDEDQDENLLEENNHTNKSSSSSFPKKSNPSYLQSNQLRDMLKILLAYSDRNLSKIEKTFQESLLIDFLLNQFN